MIGGASAGFGHRLAALVYDAVLLAAILIIYTFAALLLAHGAALVPDAVGAWAYLYRAGLIGLLVGYYLVNWLRSGQTLGMRAWRIRTVTDSGNPLSLKAAVLRTGFGILAWAPAALGVLWLYLDSEHLAVHDRLSKTRVVRLTRS
ncbi:MAG TPA: RDD family protein [Steroidobacteraceae bacterium]